MATATRLKTPEAAGIPATAGPACFPLTRRAVGPAGRYGVQVTIGHETSTFRTDSLTAAESAYDRFCRVNADDRDAQAGIYDYRAWKFLAAFRGGVGPLSGTGPMSFLSSDADRSYYQGLVL